MADFHSPKGFPTRILSTRRAALRGAIGAALAGGLASLPAGGLRAAAPGAPGTGAAKRTGLLVRPGAVEMLHTRSKMILELEGQLQVEEPNPSKREDVRKAEVKGKSTLDYFETIAFASDTAVAAARRYTTATSENWVSGNSSAQELRPECRNARLMLHAGTWEQFCPEQPLDSREVELLRSPINTAVLECLLPLEPARPESTWSIDKESAKNLFNLDAVHKSTLSARVAKVEQGTATIELEGVLEATANSVATKLEIKGNFHAKLGRHGALVPWLGLVIKEERAISESEPGFSITARVRLIRAEVDQELAIDHSELSALPESTDEGRWLVRLQSIAGRYSMLADRRWKTYIDGGEEAVLRMIENNTVLAQCNISQLPRLAEGTQLTLEALQADVKKSMGESMGAFQESSERVTSSSLRLLRCVISGELEEVPIQWIVNHLSDDTGRRVAIEFTMGGNHIERFAAADEQMTASFEFLSGAASTPLGPTPAPQVSRASPPDSRR